MLSSYYDLFEWDYRYGLPLRTAPVSHRMLEGESIGANNSVQRPFLPSGFDRAVITVLSTQDATLDVKTLLPVERTHGAYLQVATDPGATTQWVNYDSISLTGGTPKTYIISEPQPCMAWEVTMGGTGGTVDLKVDMKP